MYNGPYLRVLTPRTTNGNNPIIQDGIQQYREAHLPLAAKFHIELLNRSMPSYLKKKIEVVSGHTEQQQRHDEQANIIEQLKAELAALKTEQLKAPIGTIKTEPPTTDIKQQPAPQSMPAKPKPATPVSNLQNQ